MLEEVSETFTSISVPTKPPKYMTLSAAQALFLFPSVAKSTRLGSSVSGEVKARSESFSWKLFIAMVEGEIHGMKRWPGKVNIEKVGICGCDHYEILLREMV